MVRQSCHAVLFWGRSHVPAYQGITHPAGGSAPAGMVPHIEIASCQTPLEVQAEAHNRDGEVL